jgi:hypothetical protein
MDTLHLQEALRAANIDERFLSISGEVKDESYVLEREIGKGWCVYYSERGQRTGERFFITEEEACSFIFGRLSRDPNVKKRV